MRRLKLLIYIISILQIAIGVFIYVNDRTVFYLIWGGLIVAGLLGIFSNKFVFSRILMIFTNIILLLLWGSYPFFLAYGLFSALKNNDYKELVVGVQFGDLTIFIPIIVLIGLNAIFATIIQFKKKDSN